MLAGELPLVQDGFLNRACQPWYTADVPFGGTSAQAKLCSRRGLLARVAAALDLIHHLREVVALRRLQGRIRLERLEPAQP